jgi:hypothetical protein
MRKIIACGFISFCMLIGSVTFTMAAGNVGPADITIDEGGKKPAQFPHRKHQDAFKCGECHHQMTADGKQGPYVEGQEIKKCATCHNATVLAGRMKDKLALDTLKGAGHGNCVECHKDKKDEPAIKDKKIDKCETCHPKK